MSELTFGIALMSMTRAELAERREIARGDAAVSVQPERPDPRDHRLS